MTQKLAVIAAFILHNKLQTSELVPWGEFMESSGTLHCLSSHISQMNFSELPCGGVSKFASHLEPTARDSGRQSLIC